MARNILCACMVLFVSISAYAINSSSQWVEAIDGSLSSVERTFDGGYVAIGMKYKNDFSNVLLVRLNSAGELGWARTYGGYKEYMYASTILQAADGGFLFTGTVKNAGNTFLVKVDSAGNILWQRMYTVPGRLASSPQLSQAADGGFFLAGTIRTSYQLGTYDGWFMKLNSDGAILWQKLYGRSNNYESISAAVATSDGGFMIAGRSGHLAMSAKIRPNGSIIWQKVYAFVGYPGADALTIATTKDGGYIIGGQCHTVPFGGWFGTGWIAKLNSKGNPLWQSTVHSLTDFEIPISNTTSVTSLRQEKDGHILGMGQAGQALSCTMAGCRYSRYDIWSARLDSAGDLLWQSVFGRAVNDFVYSIHGTPDDGTVFVGNKLIGRISSTGGTCTELTRPGSITRETVSITTTPADLLIRNGKFVESAAHFVQAPVKLNFKNLCNTSLK